MDIFATLITAALTVISPLAIAYAKQEHWTKLVKIAVPIAVSVAIAVAYLWATGKLASPGDWAQSTLTVYGAQQLAYTTILRWWATILEKAGQRPPKPDGRHEA